MSAASSASLKKGSAQPAPPRLKLYWMPTLKMRRSYRYRLPPLQPLLEGKGAIMFSSS